MMGAPETIVVVGAPGAGKTTVGARLARRLGVPFIDVDALIEQRQGIPVSEIFLVHGEPEFRRIERDITLEAIALPGVVSLGGGAVMNPDVRAALQDVHVVWLQVDANHASRRVGLHGAGRPLLSGGVHSTMVRLLNQRLPLYDAVATTRVDTNGMRPAAVVRRLLTELGVPEETAGEQHGEED